MQRCVIMGDGATSPTAALIASLQSRGIATAVEANAPGVMAALVEGDVAMVVVVEPGSAADTEALVAAMRRFYPRTPCHGFEPAGEQRAAHLFALSDDETGGDTARHNDAIAARGGPVVDGGPVSPDEPGSGPSDSGDALDPDGGIALSPAELAMLLGGEPEDDR